MNSPDATDATATVALTWKFKKLSEPVIVLAATVMGLVAVPLLG
jgi:chromate transporter